MTYNLDVSFIVPTKNEQKWIVECLSSIRRNALRTHYSYEIIVIDDHSTDNTLDILASKGFSGKILEAGNVTGVSAVRNQAADAANGQILVFIDGDVILADDWHIEFQKACERILHKAIITGSQYFTDPNEKNWIVNTWFKKRKTDLHTNYINAGHMIMDHNFFNDIGQFDETLETGEDVELCNRGLKGWDVEVLNNSHLVAIHKGFPNNLKWFFNRERWHGKGNWSRNHITSKMTLLIILFWLGIFGAPFLPIWGLSIGAALGLAYGKCGFNKNYFKCCVLSATLLVARGLSLIDVFTGHISRTRS